MLLHTFSVFADVSTLSRSVMASNSFCNSLIAWEVKDNFLPYASLRVSHNMYRVGLLLGSQKKWSIQRCTSYNLYSSANKSRFNLQCLNPLGFLLAKWSSQTTVAWCNTIMGKHGWKQSLGKDSLSKNIMYKNVIYCPPEGCENHQG